MDLDRRSAALVVAMVLIAATGGSAPRHAGAAVAQDGEVRAHVRVVATGGTIAGRGRPGAVSGYESGAIPIQELLLEIPRLTEIAEVSAEQYSNVSSTSLLPSDWLMLAQRINVLLADGVDGQPVDGVVVTHGTDALEETAYFLNLTVRSDKPVVIVGAMRPATATSADGPLNLLNAVQVAAAPASRGRGAMVVLNQEINAARDATKTNANRVQTFQSRTWGLLGTVEASGPRYARRTEHRHTADSEFDVTGVFPEAIPRVDISYTYNGADGADIRAFVQAGARGIVIAASGAGATTQAQQEAARAAVEARVIVVSSTHTGSGTVGGGGRYSIGAHDLLPQKARILLMVALMHTDDPEQLRRIFSEY